jgi:hypothetical protein
MDRVRDRFTPAAFVSVCLATSLADEGHRSEHDISKRDDTL